MSIIVRSYSRKAANTVGGNGNFPSSLFQLVTRLKTQNQTRTDREAVGGRVDGLSAKPCLAPSVPTSMPGLSLVILDIFITCGPCLRRSKQVRGFNIYLDTLVIAGSLNIWQLGLVTSGLPMGRAGK